MKAISGAGTTPAIPLARMAGTAVSAVLLFAVHYPVSAQPAPEIENGRYTMTPVENGVLRLDTRTGAMSNCDNSGAGWACHVMPEEREAFDAEISRLRTENDGLKARLAESAPAISGGGGVKSKDRTDVPGDKDSAAAESQRKLELTLPSDRDIDRVMNLLARAWQRLIDIANRMQRDVSGRI